MRKGQGGSLKMNDAANILIGFFVGVAACL
jgi:hypothetical protein